MSPIDILTGAPAWVYALLVVLVTLGIRRLRTREVPVAVALLPAIAFGLWSVTGLLDLSQRIGTGIPIGAWLAGASFGWGSTLLLAEPRGERLPNARVRLPATGLPLVLYVSVFVIRFFCGAWAAIVPIQADIAVALSTGVGAAMTARLIVAVLRWRRVGP